MALPASPAALAAVRSVVEAGAEDVSARGRCADVGCAIIAKTVVQNFQLVAVVASVDQCHTYSPPLQKF